MLELRLLQTHFSIICSSPLTRGSMTASVTKMAQGQFLLRLTLLVLFVTALCVQGRPVASVSHVAHLAKSALVDHYTQPGASGRAREVSASPYKLDAQDLDDYTDPSANRRSPPPPWN